MWNVDDLQRRLARYDFTEAVTGAFRGHYLFSGETLLANMIEALEFEPDGCVQVLICTACGTVHCEPGGWVAPQRVRESIVWVPCFGRHHSEHDRAEYRVPEFVASRGVPLFAPPMASILLQLVPGLTNALRDLTAREAGLLMQFEAPARVLGRSADSVNVREDLVVAVSSGDVATRLAQLGELLKGALGSSEPIHLVDAAVLEFYLDTRAMPAWCPLAIDRNGRPYLVLDPLGAFA